MYFNRIFHIYRCSKVQNINLKVKNFILPNYEHIKSLMSNAINYKRIIEIRVYLNKISFTVCLDIYNNFATQLNKYYTYNFLAYLLYLSKQG